MEPYGVVGHTISSNALNGDSSHNLCPVTLFA